MSSNSILSQDEINALLEGVNSGQVDANNPSAGTGEVRNYDFSQVDKISRGRLPTLEMINERFVRCLRSSLPSVLGKGAEINAVGVKMTKFSEYMHSLAVPTSLNLVRIKPLAGTALFVLEPQLVFALVDSFFGGGGRFPSKVEGREFTPTENRIIQIVLREIFIAMTDAWAPVLALVFEFVNSENYPGFTHIASPTETVVVSRFTISVNSCGGDVHVTLPYSMIEPIREMLDAGMQSDRVEQDERWINTLREEILDAPVEITSTLVETRINIGDFIRLQAGDVIPIDLPDTVRVFAEKIPVLRGHFGTSGGYNAVRVLRRCKSDT